MIADYSQCNTMDALIPSNEKVYKEYILTKKEIAEYELFDIDNEGEYQTAKIKITKLFLRMVIETLHMLKLMKLLIIK